MLFFDIAGDLAIVGLYKNHQDFLAIYTGQIRKVLQTVGHLVVARFYCCTIIFGRLE
jgi:hypothetical protein